MKTEGKEQAAVEAIKKQGFSCVGAGFRGGFILQVMKYYESMATKDK